MSSTVSRMDVHYDPQNSYRDPSLSRINSGIATAPTQFFGSTSRNRSPGNSARSVAGLRVGDFFFLSSLIVGSSAVAAEFFVSYVEKKLSRILALDRELRSRLYSTFGGLRSWNVTRGSPTQAPTKEPSFGRHVPVHPMCLQPLH